MNTIESLNSYLNAIALVNSIHTGDLWWSFSIEETQRNESPLDALIYYENNSEEYEGYNFYEYEIVKLERGFPELRDMVSKLFMQYLRTTINTTMSSYDFDLYTENRESIENCLNQSTSARKNLLADTFVDATSKVVGEAAVYHIKVKERANSEPWSVLDPYFGDVFLIYTQSKAYILNLGGVD